MRGGIVQFMREVRLSKRLIAGAVILVLTSGLAGQTADGMQHPTDVSRSSNRFSRSVLMSDSARLGSSSALKIPLQVFAGGLSGLGVGFAAACIGFGIEACLRPEGHELAGLGGLFIGGITGLTVGSAFGVYIFGDMEKMNGHFAGALVGALVGGVVDLFLFT